MKRLGRLANHVVHISIGTILLRKVRIMRKTILLTLVLLMVVAASVAHAQIVEEVPDIRGTVYLRGGQVLSGVIRLGQLGVMPGAGIGTLLPEGGWFTVRVGETERTVPAVELARMEATWANRGTEQEPQWKIQTIVLTTTGGEIIAGQPVWALHASETSIEGGPTIHAFPLAGTDFSADNLIARIVLGEEALPAELPAEELPTEAAPPEEVAPEEAPAEAVTPEPTEEPVEAPPLFITEPAEEITLTIPPVTVATGPAAIGEGSYTLTIACPDCGKKIKITISAEVVPAE